MPKYVAMAGLHGCYPNFQEVYETYTEAVDALADLHELEDLERADLFADTYLELDIHEHGNEYCEVYESLIYD